MSDGGGRLSGRDAAEIAGQVAGLTAAGLPLGPGLRALGEEVPPGRLRRALGELSRAIDAGEPIEAALGSPRSGLPAHVRGIVLAGARTGRLGQVLGRFAGYADVGDDLRRSLWLRMAYPLAAIGLATTVFIFTSVAVLNPFESIYKDFGVGMPVITRLTFKVARVVTVSWRPLLEGIVALAVLWLLVGLVAGRATRNAIVANIPIIGPVLRWTSLAEFCHLLGLLLECELPMAEAVPMTGEGVPDAEIRAAGRAMGAEVARGQSLSQAMAGRRVFPAGMARIVAWAEGHRGLADALHMLGEMFEARARAQASFASSVCSVLGVLSILGGIVVTVGAVMIPMITMLNKLSGW
jgi:type II secretory pathway component PulF